MVPNYLGNYVNLHRDFEIRRDTPKIPKFGKLLQERKEKKNTYNFINTHRDY